MLGVCLTFGQETRSVAQHVDTALLYQQELQNIPPKGPFILGICSCRLSGSTNLLTTPMTLLRRPMMNISLPQGRFPNSSRAQCRNRLRPLQISWDAPRSNRRQWPNVAVPWKRGNLKFNCRMSAFLVHHPLRTEWGLSMRWPTECGSFCYNIVDGQRSEKQSFPELPGWHNKNGKLRSLNDPFDGQRDATRS